MLINNQASRDHHFIPRMLIKRFAIDGEALFLMYNVRNTYRVRPISSKGVFYRPDLNTYICTDGRKNVHLEDLFQSLDNDASRLLDQIIPAIRGGLRPRLDRHARHLLEIFFYYLRKRGPEYHEAFLPEQTAEALLGPVRGILEARHGVLSPEQITSLQSPEALASALTETEESHLCAAVLRCLHGTADRADR